MSNKALGAVCCALLLASGAAGAQMGRPLRLDDIFRFETISVIWSEALSGDGLSLAFARTPPNEARGASFGSHGPSEIWVQRGTGEEPTSITRDAGDSASWMAPKWSPDGGRLAMLSSRGGKPELWLWTKATNRLRRLTRQSVARFVWVDARHIVSYVPESEGPTPSIPALATAAWAKARAGVEPTASVLQSGVPVDSAGRNRGHLLLIDVTTGARHSVPTDAPEYWSPSPDGSYLAFCRQVGLYTPRAGEPLPPRYWQLGIHDLQLYSLKTNTVTTVGPMRLTAPETSSLRWSPDGRELAFLAFASDSETLPSLYRFRPASTQVEEHRLGGLDPTADWGGTWTPRMEWTARGKLLLFAGEWNGARRRGVDATRWDWWLVSRNGDRTNLTRRMTTPPRDLWPENGREAFVGSADGDIWRLVPQTGEIQNLTAEFDREITGLAWPVVQLDGSYQLLTTAMSSYSKVVFETGVEAHPRSTSYTRYWYHPWPLGPRNYYLFDLSEGTISPLHKPDDDARLVAFSPLSNSAVYTAQKSTGSFVWRTTLGTGQTDRILTANTYLRSISEGKFQPIDYTSLDGEPLRGWLILPPGYEKGKRYPMITWVYASLVEGSAPDPWDRIAMLGPLSKQIAAAHGYVVLVPSMPVANVEGVDDIMLNLPNGVLPAVEKAIEVGVADSGRVFLMGQSMGGYSTYGLVTETHRFKAAVALAGITDLISQHGSLTSRYRYTDHSLENLYTMMNEGFFRMGGKPPWRDWGRYVRNSPIFYVDRVQTPLMMIHGDLDGVPMQQAEEFFTSLFRQGKRAELVRYWGEGHVLEIPANIRDMWQRIFAWFDEFGDIRRDANGNIISR